MKTQKSIRIDFDNALRQASYVGECAGELQDVKKRMQEIMNELGTGWKGEAASIYLTKCEDLVNKIEKSVNDLNRISGTISKTAKIYYETEKAALALINKKSI